MSKVKGLTKRQMKLGAFMYPGGHHVAAWRHPDVSAFAMTDFKYRVAFAKAAEAAKFDLIFLADGAGIGESNVAALSRVDEWSNGFEPITLLSALSAVTERIGLVATASTSFTDPLNLARYFASLDQLSEGRAGWNLVTSSDGPESKNFHPRDLLHSARYERANEFADVVLGLWDSWEDDAFLRDKVSGRFFDPAKLHALHHKGRHFEVRGPLNVARSPQGHPALIQAGSSEVGKELAARTAEVVFTAQRTLKDAQEFYADLKKHLPQYGRLADDLKVMPGIGTGGAAKSEGRASRNSTPGNAPVEEIIDLLTSLNALPHQEAIDLGILYVALADDTAAESVAIGPGVGL